MIKKVVTVQEGSVNLKAYYDDSKKVYRVYRLWYDRGWHRQQIAVRESLLYAIEAIYYYCKGRRY